VGCARARTRALPFFHTINNTVSILLGLLYGRGDFERAITITVMCGYDTDSAGATAGSIAGLLLGRTRLPEKWIAPLTDTLPTAAAPRSPERFSDLIVRTTRIARRSLDGSPS